MDALQALADASAWALELPLLVRGIRLDADLLLSGPPVRVSAQLAEERTLRLRLPYMQGEDVKIAQTELSRRGFAAPIDGTFGPATDAAVKAFQNERGLVTDGVIGPATWSALGL
jgi:peptidoglycan hydrolase-like protein with peptidoglycan-binding domain